MKYKLPKNKWTDKQVEEHWDKVAHKYVKENNKVKYAHDQRFRKMLELFPPLPSGAKILNITSRDAEASIFLQRTYPGIRVINAEISQGLMNEAFRLWPDIEQIKISTYSSLPFVDEEFDAIVSLETLEHVAEPVAFLKELHRVIRPSGILILSCLPATSEFPYRIFTFLFGGHGEGPHRFLPSKKVKMLLKDTGWQVLHHEGTLLIPAGPVFLQKLGDFLIRKFQHSIIRELGIRQFYVGKRI